MSDAQFGILVAAITAGLGGVGVVLRWSVGVITSALTDNTKAMITNTASNAVLSTKIDTIATWVDAARITPPHGIPRRPGTNG